MSKNIIFNKLWVFCDSPFHNQNGTGFAECHGLHCSDQFMDCFAFAVALEKSVTARPGKRTAQFRLEDDDDRYCHQREKTIQQLTQYIQT